MLEQTLTEGGYFFRQYPLVVGGQIVENKPKGKAIRKALAEIGGKICVVMSREKLTFHDFSQLLIDAGARNAIYLVGSSSHGFYINDKGEKILTGKAPWEGVENVSYIIWEQGYKSFHTPYKPFHTTPGKIVCRANFLTELCARNNHSNLLRYMKIFNSLVLFIMICVGITSCQYKNQNTEQSVNSIYYWRTVLELDSLERDFMQANKVRKMYIRFFDIVADKSPIAMDVVVPNATLQIKDSLPVKDIIPTIYITPEAITKMQSDEKMWAEKIIKRIYNMCSYNELIEPNEVQLDCDWTDRTQSVFFAVCNAVKKELQKRNPKARLSVTIRLHQLRTPVPPVDYGVLMLYNTGSFKDSEEPNSILTVESVKPYLKYLANYSLPLEYAYPIFSWELVYDSDKHFKGLLNSSSDIPENILTHLSMNNYEITKDTIISKIFLHKGDIIRKEDASFKTLMEVKELIEQNSRNKNCNVILYQLDKKNISNYSSDEFKQIYK